MPGPVQVAPWIQGIKSTEDGLEQGEVETFRGVMHGEGYHELI